MTGIGEASTVVLEQSAATMTSMATTARVDLPTIQVAVSTVERTEESHLAEGMSMAAAG